MTGHREAFISRAPASLRSALANVSHLDAQLAEVVSSARDGYQQIAIDDADFLGYVAGRLTESDGVNALDKLRFDDLYLACGCARGIDVAIDTFRKTFSGALRGVLSREGAPDFVEEVIQHVFAKLFVAAPDRPATIERYAGRGKLSTWLLILAVREARYLRRGEKHNRRADVDILEQQAAADDDPELQYLKQTYRAKFKAAFQQAFAELSVRGRNVLRHHYLEGLSSDQIGVVYGAHRTSVARWRAEARATLFSKTRRIMEQELAIKRDELDSVMHLIESQFDVSLSRLLRSSREE